jgi:tetratricopeptide (TPR) repeat protein
MAANDLDSAIRFFQASAQMEAHFKTLELLGECFLKGDQNREAIIPLAAAVGLGNTPYRALYFLAEALRRLGHREEAIEKLNVALQIKPDYKNARTLLGAIRAGTD